MATWWKYSLTIHWIFFLVFVKTTNIRTCVYQSNSCKPTSINIKTSLCFHNGITVINVDCSFKPHLHERSFRARCWDNGWYWNRADRRLQWQSPHSSRFLKLLVLRLCLSLLNRYHFRRISGYEYCIKFFSLMAHRLHDNLN